MVLSHALFWVMTQSFRGPLSKSKHFLLMRQYEEEMLEAYLTEDEYFPELLRYCNIMFEVMPIILSTLRDSKNDNAVRRLLAIGIVAGGYGGDCKEETCNELLDDIDFHFNRVKCRKIESLLPLLNDYVSDEIQQMR